MNSATFHWPKSQLSCSSRSSLREPKKPLSSSLPTYPSPSGPRSSPTHGSARLCSIGSPTRRTSSRPVQSRTASGEPCGRRPRTKPGYSVLLPLRPLGYAPAEPNTHNINVPEGGPKQTAEVGQAKLPKSSRFQAALAVGVILFTSRALGQVGTGAPQASAHVQVQTKAADQSQETPPTIYPG